MYQSTEEIGQVPLAKREAVFAVDADVPDYLRRHYWWAYIHPWAVKFFDRHWIINLILLGNYTRLRDAALAEFPEPSSHSILQIACAYGDLTIRLAKRVAAGKGKLDIIDILPIQLKNLKWKLPGRSPVRLLQMDSTDLKLPDASYDCVLLFFLLHEQPAYHRAKTLREAARVVKPGGKIVIVDFARPYWWNPLLYLWRPLLALLEPFALDLWHDDILDYLPSSCRSGIVKREALFGGFYQKLIITR